MPATANKFVHILWKNLICDNVAAVGFCARPRGRGCWRCKVCAYRLREGDAPARCRYAGAVSGAQCAPLRGERSVWRAGVVAQNGAPRSSRPTKLHGNSPLAPYGVAVVPLPLTRQMGGSRKASLTLTRAARPEGKGVIRKRGETIGVSPLVRLPRAAALSARFGKGTTLPFFLKAEYLVRRDLKETA